MGITSSFFFYFTIHLVISYYLDPFKIKNTNLTYRYILKGNTITKTIGLLLYINI
jgi:hypothetical protein